MRAHELWMYWAWQEVRRNYHRTVFGPLWITLGMMIYAVTLSFVFGRLFGASPPRFVPWVTCGVVAWSLINGTVGEASTIFPAFRTYILQSDRPLLIYIAYSLARNLIVFAHHLLAVVAVLVYFGDFRLLALPAMLVFLPLFVLAFGWVAIVIAILATRYRDVAPIIANLMQVLFFVTPIMFIPDMVPDIAPYLRLNPLAHLVDLIREPLLGRVPSSYTLIYCAMTGMLGWTLAIALYRRARPRVAYWL
jgi:ABC-type polysaccharide/polyol phosphate export permease